MDVLKKLNNIFSREQKIKFFLLFGLMFIGALFEAVGVSLILPFVSIITDPSTIKTNNILNYIYNFLNLHTVNEFLLVLCLTMIVVYTFKNVFLMFMYYCQYRFTFNNQMRMSVRLIDCYLHKPYTFHLQKNSAEIVRSVTDDVNRLFALVLSTILMISEILVALMLTILLFLTDALITMIVLALLTLSIGSFIAIFKDRIKIYGQEERKSILDK